MMYKGVLIDWFGVLTTGLADAFAIWLTADRIDGGRYRDVMSELVVQAYDGGRDGENSIHALERGEIDPALFERELAARLVTLDGAPPVAEGMLARMFGNFERVEAMYAMLRAARAGGLRTCLLSNSWGTEYPREGWEELFDEVVISGEVGMRKPEPRIFRLALDRVGLPAEQCVFIDDTPANIAAAEALGITGLHHRDPAETIPRLEELVGMPLRAA